MVVTVAENGGVAVVTIDNLPVNATSQAVRQGLMEAVAQTEADQGVTAVVLACAGKTFVAGADASEFGKPPLAPHLPDVIDAIEGATKPWGRGPSWNGAWRRLGTGHGLSRPRCCTEHQAGPN